MRDDLRGFVAAMSASLEGPPPGTRRPNGFAKPPKAEKHAKPPEDDSPTKDPTTCEHPKERWNQLPYGTFCTDCGMRVDVNKR